MKLFLCTVFVVILLSSYAQNDCHKFKRGKFYVVLPKNRAIGLVKIETIKLTKIYETNTTKIHC